MGLLSCMCGGEPRTTTTVQQQVETTTTEQEQVEAFLLHQLSIQERLEAQARKEKEERQALVMELSLEENLLQLPLDEDEQLAMAMKESLALHQQAVSHEAASTSRNSLPECEYCCENPVDAAFDPCGHGACLRCAELIENRDNKLCPLCRTPVSKVIKLYIS